MSGILDRRSLCRDTCQRQLDVIKPNRFCYFEQNNRFREKLVCVVVSICIFMLVDQLLLVEVVSQLYYCI